MQLRCLTFSCPLLQPIKYVINIFKWFGRVITWAFIHLTMITPAYSYPNYEDYGLCREIVVYSDLFQLILNTGSYADASTLDPTDNRPEPSVEDKLKVDNSVIINRTRLQPCDKVISLYTLG